jgi:hypothetical protein
MRNNQAYLLLFITLFIQSTSFSQALPVGTTVLEDFWRLRQVKGEKDRDISFSIRPIHANSQQTFDSLFKWRDFTTSDTYKGFSFFKGRGITRPLPLTLKQQYNSHHPYGWNDGSMIPAKGYQVQLSFGLYSSIGPLSIHLQPEIVYAQNAAFNTFTFRSDSTWKSYYQSVINVIDQPDRLSDKSYTRFFPGQSSIRFNYKQLSLGLSSENLWWGPGVRNSLIMSNNAPGFLHVSFNSIKPVTTPIGSFEWQVVAGKLKSSGIQPDTTKTFEGRKLFVPKPKDDRYLNGMVVTFQPKWTKGLHFGFSRVFYLISTDLQKSFDGYLPVIGKFFKSKTPDEDNKKRDQLLSFFVRLILPTEKAEVYGELGRNDHSHDMRDFLLEPEHSRAYIIGFKKNFETSKSTELQLMGEFANLKMPSTILLREQQSWYTHYQVRDGYTNHGQVIGAGIGPGGSSQTVGLAHLSGINKLGLTLERVVHNNDFYYEAFGPARDFLSHWVDLSANLNKIWQVNNILIDANITYIKSINYQWQRNNNPKNLQAACSFLYMF